MDDFKPEDELKPDPSDRRPVRSRNNASEADREPRINVDDIDVDDEYDERRASRSRRSGREEEYDEYETDDEMAAQAAERRPRQRNKALAGKGPVSRQHLMMGVGILVLLLLIIGIGSALNSPPPSSDTASQSGPKDIDLSTSGSATASAQPASGEQQQNAAPQDVSLPPISSTPTQGQAQVTPQGQQRVEVQGDLNTALTQQEGQIDAATGGTTTLPTQPATVSSTLGGAAQGRQPARTESTASTVAPRERQRTTIEVEPRKTQATQSRPQATAKAATPEQKPAATAKRPENTTAVRTPAATSTSSTAPKAASSTATTTAPAATASSAAVSTGNVGAMKSASGSSYTLQLSSSSNYDNLNAWAKKSSLQNYVVYQTQRNGKPWYVLVSGIYASRDEAKRAVATLPADVQAKNPWAKPIHQVQSDLKQ
ncbi:cell division protein DamX [Entomohabitans teleogrylli]|uniref:cell division protein DamX n=1 Tax=Entomohabitans teleogrylli TaxID=1384589 RepID=UPI00073D78C6|nr:cell division protein DamX [Entomohabitans teleogrylli]